VAATDFFGLTDDGRSLALQGDGKIVVSGWASQSINGTVVKRKVVLRYNVGGSLDTSFGVGGNVFSDAFAVMTSSSWPNPTVALQPVNGQVKILLSGGSSDLSNANFMLERYNADGSLDTTFGTAGQTQSDFGQAMDYIHRLVGGAGR